MTGAIGATRNLTPAFLRYRNEAKRSRIPDVVEDRATAKLLGAALGDSAEGDIELGAVGGGGDGGSARAPAWVRQSERIKADMAQLRDRLARLKEYHSKALLVTFDDGGGASSHADALTREIQISFRRLDHDIRALSGAGASGGGGGGGSGGGADGGVAKQVQRQLAQALFKLSVEFRKEETRFLNKIEAQKGYEAGSSIGLIEEEAPSGGGGGGAGGAGFDGGGGFGGGGGGGAGFTQAQLMKVSQAESLVEERDQEIRKVVEAIVELAQIMRDLSTLVVEQGTMLDRIDHNITQTAIKVEEGVKQLVRAEKHQKSGRAMTCIVVLCVLIAIFLVITIVRHS